MVKDKVWIKRHVNDLYVNLSHRDGYRSRAAYKLLEILKTNRLLDGVSRVVELGCAPGSWTQVILENMSGVGSIPLIIGVDLLPMEPLVGARFIQGDFTDDIVLSKLVSLLNDSVIDLVLSDMSPNLSGISGVDQARSANLVELALYFCKDYLKNGGSALIKVFQGSEFSNLVKLSRDIFENVSIKKPNASRSKSRETYLLCKNKVN